MSEQKIGTICVAWVLPDGSYADRRTKIEKFKKALIASGYLSAEEADAVRTCLQRAVVRDDFGDSYCDAHKWGIEGPK